jgi:hypothetical protein
MQDRREQGKNLTWMMIVPGQVNVRMYLLAVESVADILGVKLWKLCVPS